MGNPDVIPEEMYNDALIKIDELAERILTLRHQPESHLTRYLETDGADEWMGFRPSMPDSPPVIGPSPRYNNAFFAFGHGHSGLTLGAVTGNLIADLVMGRVPPIDLGPYRADRF